MKNHHTPETFVETLENNVETILQEKKELPRNNVLRVIKLAIHYLTKREDIVITKVDKGRTTAITCLTEYQQSKENQQLKDGKFHEKGSHNFIFY